jgi:ribosomal protein L39E
MDVAGCSIPFRNTPGTTDVQLIKANSNVIFLLPTFVYLRVREAARRQFKLRRGWRSVELKLKNIRKVCRCSMFAQYRKGTVDQRACLHVENIHIKLYVTCLVLVLVNASSGKKVRLAGYGGMPKKLSPNSVPSVAAMILMR